MLRPIATFLARLDLVYRDQSYVAGVKARLLAGFNLLVVLFVPFNLAKLLWLQPPGVGARVVFNLSWLALALVSLLWIQRGRLAAAGNYLVIGATLSANLLMLLAPAHAQPLSGAFQLFIFNFVILLLALVFTSRRIAVGLLVTIVACHLGLYLHLTGTGPLPGSLDFAAATLVRDGLIAFGFVFCFGILLAAMIESAHQRSEEAFRAVRATNDNLERLVAERTHDLTAATELAQEASRAKSEFLGNMSHEIRTPLNGIIATADLLRQQPDLDPRSREHVQLIGDSGELLLKLIGDILDLAKIEAGKLELEADTFSLAKLAGDATAMLATTAGQARIDFSCSLAPELEGYWIGDRLRLQQVLLNLGSNAIKFTPAGGEVRIGITGQPGNESNTAVRFEVRDSGIGMDEAAQRRIFERFMQADASTTRKFGGTGLGLAISARIVEAMGGQLEVSSSPGQGSCFFFTLPMQTVASPEPTLSEASSPSHPLGLTVLVTDDNPMNRKIIGAQLSRLGCPCMIAEDGEAALLQLSDTPRPDVVLMDCHMPGIDGWETTRRIRAWAEDSQATPDQREAAKLPIIALSAAVRTEDRERCLAAGMNEFLSKPARLEDLHTTLAPYCRPRQDTSAA